ncbi:hypothetical protein [Sulfitobacter sp. 915]|uniref:hypothetical protein n=1 Tax=Sulfitobacter sp. 915 TaxID=3368558 RepID=UPI0037471D68
MGKIKFSSLFWHAIHAFIGTVANRLFFISLSALAAKSLLPSDFQNFTAILLFANTVVASLGFSLGMAFLKRTNEHNIRAENPQAERNISSLFLASVATILLFVGIGTIFSDTISQVLLSSSTLFALYLILISVFGVAATAASNALVAIERFKEISNIKTKTTVFFLVLCLTGYAFPQSQHRLTLFLILCAAYNLTLFALYIRKYVEVGEKFRIFSPSLSDRPGIISIGLNAFLSNAVYSVSISIVFLLIRDVNPGSNDATMIAVAFTWYNSIVFIPQIMSSVLLPRMLRSGASGFSEHLRTAAVVNTGTVFVSIAVLYLFSSTLDSIYEAQLPKLSELVLAMSISALPNALCKITGQYFLVVGKMHLGFWFNLGWALAFTGTSLYFYESYSVFGIAYALFISYCLLFLAQLFYTGSRR